MKLWKTSTADNKFRNSVKERDNWICARCGKDFKDNKKMYHCSHFWGETRSSTRFNYDNCIGLCYICHYGDKVNGWEFNKQGEYRDFMIKKLGEKKFNELTKLANSLMSRRESIINFMKEYETLPILWKANSKKRKKVL
jgi:hypothetical protein